MESRGLARLTKVHCPHTECEANQEGICALEEVYFTSDSFHDFICLQKFEAADRAQGYIPAWECMSLKHVRLEPEKGQE